jgi:hypothetical protein
MESTRWDETWHRLREWTNGQAQSERLAAQILIFEGFEGIDPSHPLGGPDGGKDATCRFEDELWVMAVYFPRGKKRISDIEAKLSADIESARKHKPAGIAFVTNQELSLSQRERLKKIAPPSRIAIFHLERITSILDAPQMAGVRQQFLSIESIDAKPILEVGFYEPKSRAPLGKTIDVNCIVHDESLGYIPNLETPRQTYALGLSMPADILQELNPSYMREKDKYERARALLRETTIGIRNLSTRLAEGVILEIEGTLADGIQIHEELPRCPERMRINARMPHIRPLWWDSHITPSIDEYEGRFRVTIKFGSVQPGHISLMDAPILIGSKKAASLTMNTRVVANNLPVPDESSLEVRFMLENRLPFDLDFLRV